MLPKSNSRLVHRLPPFTRSLFTPKRTGASTHLRRRHYLRDVPQTWGRRRAFSFPKSVSGPGGTARGAAITTGRFHAVITERSQNRCRRSCPADRTMCLLFSSSANGWSPASASSCGRRHAITSRSADGPRRSGNNQSIVVVNVAESSTTDNTRLVRPAPGRRRCERNTPHEAH